MSTTAAGLAGREGELATIRKRLDSSPRRIAGQRDAGCRPGAQATSSTTSRPRPRTSQLASTSRPRRSTSLKAQLASRETDSPPASDELRAMLDDAPHTDRVARRAPGGSHRGGARRSAGRNRPTPLPASLRASMSLRAAVEAATARVCRTRSTSSQRCTGTSSSPARASRPIVDDLREALGAFPETDPDALAALTATARDDSAGVASVASRVDRLEGAHVDDLRAELGERIDLIDKRVETVAVEIKRAKTLWPVALRSLEARLDDLALATARRR